tara:strand:- start:712 stop:1605 length:894 start_codon:yes stop_codon:yes gene_type:complete
MRFNEIVVGQHPATNGYELEFFVQNNQEPTFLSGSGSFFVEFPKFAITGLEFRGQNLVFAPTGSDLQLMSDVEIIKDFVELRCFFSGDLNGFSGVAKENIKLIDVYSGSYAGFQPDTIALTNYVKGGIVNVDKIDPFLTFTVYDTDIQNRVDNLFYKVVPLDYLTFGESSYAVSGIMFTGFESFSSITQDQVIIDRSNGNDLRFSVNAGITDIFTGTTIILSNNIPLDFEAYFRVRTNSQNIVITTTGGALLQSSSTEFPSISNTVTISPGNNLAEFNINCLLSSNGTRDAFIISES